MALPLKGLISKYNYRKREIANRLKEFRAVGEGPDREIFSELCFCITTANANALRCNEAIGELKKRGLLFKAAPSRIRPVLKGRVRFHNKKADFIVGARCLFKKGEALAVKNRLNRADVFATRDWLVQNIKGFGYKEASHFLRNIGLGADMAILDRHILKNLKRYGVIPKVPASVGSRKIYMAIEDRMRSFSKKAEIPLDALDLLFWSIQTGFVFK